MVCCLMLSFLDLLLYWIGWLLINDVSFHSDSHVLPAKYNYGIDDKLLSVDQSPSI